MSFIRSFAPTLLMPLFVAIVALLAGIILRRRALLWTAVCVLWIGSTPAVSRWLGAAVENQPARIPAAEAGVADAIVVLSSGRPIAPGPAAISEWNDPDRFFGGVELFLAGKAPLLVFTGAWSAVTPDAPLEGEVLAGYARAMGVPADRIATTGRVTNTAEEARAVAALLGRGQTAPVRILLVTSAFHMSRAQRAFERAGLGVTPFPVDFHRSGEGFSAVHLLPSAAALCQTEGLLREVYGRVFYRVTGA
jgi:uncharacterized SAM-binding protein YcdF (DUF218 family)